MCIIVFYASFFFRAVGFGLLFRHRSIHFSDSGYWKTRDCCKFILFFTILWISMGLTTCLSSLWVRKHLRVYTSRMARKPCWRRYLVTYMMMLLFEYIFRAVRSCAYCNNNGLYYYSFERVTRAGRELLTIYLRWNPLTRSLAILFMRFSTW